MNVHDFREQISKFDPIDSLSEQHFASLLNKAELVNVAAGKTLFKEGEVDKCHYFLLQGQIKVTSSQEPEAIVTADNEAGRQAIASFQPRKHTAIAQSNSLCLKIEAKTLELLLSWDHAAKYIVKELRPENRPDSADWMEALLCQPLFQSISPLHLQMFFAELEPLSVPAREVIFQQNEPGDFFYILSSGSAAVTRTTKAHPEGLELTRLYRGDLFGEDALISDRPRSATITMLENGSVQRLPKIRFEQLLAQQVVRYEDYDAAVSQDTVWLDVRLPSEFHQFHLPDSINIPLIYLRIKYNYLDPNKHYTVYCDTGARSAAAAFILCNKGLDVRVLNGGLRAAKASMTTASQKALAEVIAS